MKVESTLAQRRDDSTDVEPTLGQPTLLSGIGSFVGLYYQTQTTINVGPTSELASQRWANVEPTNIAVWEMSSLIIIASVIIDCRHILTTPVMPRSQSAVHLLAAGLQRIS